MKKRFLILIAVLVVAVSVLATTATAATQEFTAYCEYCGTEETWTAYTPENKDDLSTTGHYYLPTGNVFGYRSIPAGAKVCLHLNGYTYIASRQIYLEDGAVLNIQGEGSIDGRGADKQYNDIKTDYGAGGVIRVKEGAVLNLYGSTLRHIDSNLDRGANLGGIVAVYGTFNMHSGTICDGITVKNTDNKQGMGGNVAVYGTFNMYDGLITNGTAADVGDNVFVDAAGTFNMYGGSITTGDTDYSVDNVYVRGKTTLANGASIDCMNVVPRSNAVPIGDILNIESTFTGTADVRLDGITEANIDVGNVAADADISGLTPIAADFLFKEENGNLVTYLPQLAAIMSGDTVVKPLDSLEDALEQVGDGQYIKLQRCPDETTVTITKDVTLDLNGHDLSDVNVTNGTLYVKDSKTDDYTVGDGDYGKIGTYKGNVTGVTITENEEYYLPCTESDGTSFHKLRMVVTGMSLRPQKVALYFESDFKGDEKIKEQIKSFGVAMSLSQADLTSGSLADCAYTAISREYFNKDSGITSSLLTNIMKTDQGSITNRRNAAAVVYGKPYIKFNNGDVLWGTLRNRSLKQQVELIENNTDGYLNTDTKRNDFCGMYFAFNKIMTKWNLTNLHALWQEHENETLKILTIGNSHAIDSNWQLQNVLANEAPEQKVTVGILYYSGCTVAQHVNFATNNLAEYQYYKNETGSWEGDGTPLDTMKQALEDEQWDIILLQEMNFDLGQDSSFQNNNLQTLINYVKANTTGTPKLGFNMVWANPVADAYLDADTRMTHSMENGQSLDGWIKTYNNLYSKDQQYMFQCMLDNTNGYILANDTFDDQYIMPSGTAVQYAHNALGLTDLDLYRDYTHLSDFSRLMVSYLWYAKLTGATSLSQINVDEIPTSLRHSRFTTEGKLVITDEMKQIMLAAVNYALAHSFENVPAPVEKESPKDDTLDVLLIGNSFCTYFTDELKAMADAAGQNLNVCNVYYSGCSLAQHYQFLKNAEQVYEYSENGVKKAINVSLWYCMNQHNWDVISFQEGSSVVRSANANVNNLYKTNVKNFAYLYDSVRERFPEAKLAFHQTWAYQVGITSTKFTTADEAAQASHHQRIQAYTYKFLERYPKLELVNSGDAWALIREEENYDDLCARLGKKSGDAGSVEDDGDNYHDGDIGGGQFLNACVWYEYLFQEEGLDARENDFVPTYDRPGTSGQGTLNTQNNGGHALRIDAAKLKEAAHTAFANAPVITPAQ